MFENNLHANTFTEWRNVETQRVWVIAFKQMPETLAVEASQRSVAIIEFTAISSSLEMRFKTILPNLW